MVGFGAASSSRTHYDILIIKRSSSHKQGLISNKHRRNNSLNASARATMYAGLRSG
jgi:hypothetical protein